MLLIKKGRVIDPANKRDEIADVLIDDGKITAIEKEIPATKDMRVIEAKDYIVAPGLIDNHVHFRDPGLTYKEDLETGANAAKAGGFTSVVCMANTSPVVDNVATLKDIFGCRQCGDAQRYFKAQPSITNSCLSVCHGHKRHAGKRIS